MALIAAREIDRYIDQEIRTFRVKAAQKIYKNALVGLDAATGYVRGLILGDRFVGVAYETADNSAGAGGAITVRVYTITDMDHAMTVAQTDVGRPVFASADDTLTFVAAGNSYVGVVQDVVSASLAIIRIDAARRMVKTVVHAVENLAANADIAARAIHSFEQEGWIVSARIVNQASAAAGIDAGNTCVVALAINAGAVASKTYNNAVVFPAANTEDSLGTITNHHANPGDVLTLAVTNGTTANPGPFLVEVDYV